MWIVGVLSRKMRGAAKNAHTTLKLSIVDIMSTMDSPAGFDLWEGIVHAAQPALPFGVHTLDDLVDVSCRGGITECGEAQLNPVQEIGGAL
jgi:hypothetical protein